MALNRIVKPVKYFTSLSRRYSTDLKFFNVSHDTSNGVATLTMQRQPVNSLNYELLKEFSTILEEVQTQKVKGLILSSSLKTIFSGGLDIMEMYKPNNDRAKAFWIALQDAWLALYTTQCPTVAAINGHSPAGGCLLAMSCEYRVMVNNFTIGLNETKLGIVAPFWFISVMESVIGKREAELALTAGKLYSTEEALKIKLIDEAASDKDDAIRRSNEFFKKFKGIHPLARALTKQELRAKLVDEFEKRREEDLEMFLHYIQQSVVQKGLEAYLQALKSK